MTQQIRMCLWIAFVACLVACTSAGNDPAATAVPANQPNPASVHCQEQGGRLEIRTGEGGEYGVCVFTDGSECDEWAFFRGECQPGSTDQ
jgi:putative hemolysin